MHELTNKEYKEYRDICEKEGIIYDTDAEYRDAAYNLYRYVELAYGLAVEQNGWEQRLKNEPKGFWLDSEGRTCFVCHTNVHGQIWFDKWGLKCANCQDAFIKNIFPGYILRDKNNDRHITDAQLRWKFKLHRQTIKKLVRDGRLKPRLIPNGPMIFLKKENPDLPSVISEVAD